MTTWFIADLHLGHKGIIKHCKYPFDSVEEMNTTLIENFNKRVKDNDTVYILGDFAWKGFDHLVYSLNGQKHYIKGNHDKNRMDQCKTAFESMGDYKKIVIEGQVIILCHYPFREWEGMYRGSWHLHGHTHGTLCDRHSFSLDISANNIGLNPISFEELKEFFKNDQHRKDNNEQEIKYSNTVPNMEG